jgi:hypothetical protein
MKTCFSILVLLILFSLISCQDPSGLDATKTIQVIHDPNNLPAVFELEPGEIDFGIIHPGKTYSKNFLISNISSKNVKINTIKAINFPVQFIFSTSLPIDLKPKGTQGHSQSVALSFISDKPGNFTDMIDWVDYKNPRTNLIAKVASVWAEDVKFVDTKVGEYDLKVLNIVNSSDAEATITEFELIDPEGVIILSPPFVLPTVIEPNSSSRNIFLTFNSSAAILFKAQIRIKVTYSGSVEHFTDEIIELEGRGIY